MAKTKPTVKKSKAPNRPLKNIDWDLVDKLLIAGCDGTQIAPHFDIHPTNFYIRVEKEYGMSFTDYQQQKRAQGDSKLLCVQYDKACSGDNVMLVWLGKQRLKQKENPDSNTDSKILENFDSLMSLLAKRQKEHSEELSVKESKPSIDRTD